MLTESSHSLVIADLQMMSKLSHTVFNVLSEHIVCSICLKSNCYSDWYCNISSSISVAGRK